MVSPKSSLWTGPFHYILYTTDIPSIFISTPIYERLLQQYFPISFVIRTMGFVGGFFSSCLCCLNKYWPHTCFETSSENCHSTLCGHVFIPPYYVSMATWNGCKLFPLCTDFLCDLRVSKDVDSQIFQYFHLSDYLLFYHKITTDRVFGNHHGFGFLSWYFPIKFFETLFNLNSNRCKSCSFSANIVRSSASRTTNVSYISFFHAPYYFVHFKKCRT